MVNGSRECRKLGAENGGNRVGESGRLDGMVRLIGCLVLWYAGLDNVGDI